VPSSSLQALLTRAGAALLRGRGAEAAQLLAPAFRSTTLTRDEELAVRSMMAEATLLQDDLDQAAAALGRPPDTFRDTVPSRRLSTLWRLHGRLASARGDQSRAIGLLVRALKHAETAHDSTAIGLAHYELGQCYRQVGDLAILREHITKAASALHAAGDRRHLALVHSLSGVSLAQLGRNEEAMAALRQAERLAAMVQADDVLAIVCGNQANVTMLQHHYEQRWRSPSAACAARSAWLGHGLAVALATSDRSASASGTRPRRRGAAPGARRPQPDSVSRDDRRRLRHAGPDSPDPRTLRHRQRFSPARRRCVRRLRAANQQVVRMVGAGAWRATRAEAATLDEAVARADEIVQAGAPPFDSPGDADCRRGADRRQSARRGEQRLAVAADALDPRIAPAAWGEYLRLRGAVQAKTGNAADAYHDLSQSAALLDLLGERYQAALSHLALGRLVAETGARSVAERHLNWAIAIFSQLGAERDLEDTHAAQALLTSVGTGQYVISPADADDAIVRRIVDAAALPELLGRETAAALLEAPRPTAAWSLSNWPVAMCA
jgi:tetratricopeptide (TPR) repeat protein